MFTLKRNGWLNRFLVKNTKWGYSATTQDSCTFIQCLAWAITQKLFLGILFTFLFSVLWFAVAAIGSGVSYVVTMIVGYDVGSGDEWFQNHVYIWLIVPHIVMALLITLWVKVGIPLRKRYTMHKRAKQRAKWEQEPEPPTAAQIARQEFFLKVKMWVLAIMGRVCFKIKVED